jgi:hypothetical protein
MAELKLIDEGGWKLVRVDLNWPRVETVKGEYNFAYGGKWPIDVIYENWHKKLGNRLLFLICDVGPNVHGAPFSPEWQDGFVKFAAETVAHYKGSNSMYELLNESFGGPITDKYPATLYVDLARRAAKAMREVDPTVKIIGPAVGPTPEFAADYLKEWFKLGLLDIVDAVSVHPYTWQGPPEKMVQIYANVRYWMQRYGGKVVPLMSSENGWYTVPATNGVSLKTQADYLVRYQLINLSQNICGSIEYEFRNGNSERTNPETNYGVMNTPLEPTIKDAKPAYLAMQKMTQAIKGKTYSERLITASNEDWLLVFTGPDGEQILAAWTAAKLAHTLEVDGWGSINLTGTPIYVEKPKADGK